MWVTYFYFYAHDIISMKLFRRQFHSHQSYWPGIVSYFAFHRASSIHDNILLICWKARGDDIWSKPTVINTGGPIRNAGANIMKPTISNNRLIIPPTAPQKWGMRPYGRKAYYAKQRNCISSAARSEYYYMSSYYSSILKAWKKYLRPSWQFSLSVATTI